MAKQKIKVSYTTKAVRRPQMPKLAVAKKTNGGKRKA